MGLCSMDIRRIKDVATERLFQLATITACIVIVPMLAGLYFRSRPLLAGHSAWKLLVSSEWQPMAGRFGMVPFVVGTVYVTLLAMVISVPVSLLSAIYLSEYSPRPLRAVVLPLVDLLGGIPSVIYGVFGILVIVPAVSRLSTLLGGFSSGYCLLSGALVLAIMVSPFIINVAREVLVSVPAGIREASMALGATKWQTVKCVVLRRALPGVTAAVMLGLARALGETIAVLMVVGNVPLIPKSLFDPAYPLPALLANNYGEMMSIPMYDSALLFSALVLLLVVLAFNLLARLALLLAIRGR